LQQVRSHKDCVLIIQKSYKNQFTESLRLIKKSTRFERGLARYGPFF